MRNYKKAIGPVIMVSLLLALSVVTYGVLNSWYSEFLSDFESKKLQSLATESSVTIVGMKNESGGIFVYSKNLNPGYTIVTWVKVNGNECILDGSNVLAPTDTTKIKVVCPSYETVNDLAILTDFYVSDARKKLE